MNRTITKMFVYLILMLSMSVLHADKLYADKDNIYIKKESGETVEMKMPKA